MRRDMDLLRKILLHIEAFSDVPPKVLCVEDFRKLCYEPHVISLHLELLRDAGFIEVVSTAYNGTVKDFDISRLTFAGYEYLDAVRDKDRWDVVRGKIVAVGGATMEVIKQLAIKELSKELGL